MTASAATRPAWACLVLAALLGLAPHAGAQTDERIAFVRVELDRDGARVLQVEARPGRLKRGRSAPAARPIPAGRLGVEVHAADGTLVWAGLVPDPLATRYESVDADGRLVTYVDTRDRAEVTVRIPLTAPTQTLTLLRSEQGARAVAARLEVTL